MNDEDIARVTSEYLIGNAALFVNMLPDPQFLKVRPLRRPEQYEGFNAAYLVEGTVFDVFADLVKNDWYYCNDEELVFHHDNAEVLPLQLRTSMCGEYEVEKTEQGLVLIVREIEPVPAVAALRTKDGFIATALRTAQNNHHVIRHSADLLYGPD